MLTALPSIGSRFPPAFSLFRGLFALHIVCFSFPYTMARNVLAVVAGAGALAVQNPVIADVWVGMMPRRLPVSRFLACQAGTLAQYFMSDLFAQFAEHRDRPDAGADLGPSAEPDPRVALSFEVILLLCVLQLLFLIIKRMSAQSQPVINVFIDKVRQSVNGSLRARVDHGTPVSVAAVPLVSQPAERPAGTKHSDESQFVCSKCEVHIDTCELAQFTECFHVLHKSCSRFCVACVTEGLKGRAWCPECLRSHISTHLTSNPVLSETPPRKIQFEESVPPFCCQKCQLFLLFAKLRFRQHQIRESMFGIVSSCRVPPLDNRLQFLHPCQASSMKNSPQSCVAKDRLEPIQTSVPVCFLRSILERSRNLF